MIHHYMKLKLLYQKGRADINANLIWGIQQDDKLDGKFKFQLLQPELNQKVTTKI